MIFYVIKKKEDPIGDCHLFWDGLGFTALVEKAKRYPDPNSADMDRTRTVQPRAGTECELVGLDRPSVNEITTVVDVQSILIPSGGSASGLELFAEPDGRRFSPIMDQVNGVLSIAGRPASVGQVADWVRSHDHPQATIVIDPDRYDRIVSVDFR